MSANLRAIAFASLTLASGLGSTCPNESPPDTPGPTEHCGDPDYAESHELLCFGGCKDPQNLDALGCAPCIGNGDDPLCGGGCDTDCTSSSSSSTTEAESTTTSTTTGGETSSSSSGDTEVDDESVVEIVTGNSHTCVRLGNGAVRCWGHVYWNGLGVGEAVGDDELPSAVDDVDIGGVAIDIDAGSHTCAVLETGGLRCWGWNDDGQLGTGLSSLSIIGDDETPATIPEIWFNPGAADPLNDPPPADAPHAVVVSTEERGTCVLLDDERVWCWGAGSVMVPWPPEAIGAGSHASAATPHTFQVALDGITRGDDVACVHTTAGGVRCWGLSYYGALGYPGVDQVEDGFTAAGFADVDVGATVMKLVSSTVGFCALTDVPDVRCWGPHSGEAHGNLNIVGDNETPASVGGAALGGDARDVCFAPTHACAVLDDGTVRCFGTNNLGHLGYGHYDQIGDDELPSSEPAIDFGREAVAISCAGAHTCVLLEDGAVRCWGANGAGQLGLGHTDDVIDADDPAVPDVEVQ